ncbi:MAG: type II toxin-antitoxin system Phd/YefM family antitoxin [Candidatus Dormibacteria bacterium]
MRIKATEASRGFSELLSRAAAGESVEIYRHGQVVAIVSPPRRGFVQGDLLLETLRRVPRPDDGFSADVRRLAAIAGQPAEPWPS